MVHVLPERRDLILSYLKAGAILLLKLSVVVFAFYLLSLLVGCGDLYSSSPYGYSSGSSYYRSSSCESICASHCRTCWSWNSDIMICERDCTRLCRQRGCDYVDVPSPRCDETFQSVCM